MSDRKKKRIVNAIFFTGSCVLCGFAGYKFACWYGKPAKIGVITNEAVTKPGIIMKPKMWKMDLGSHNFIFKNVTEAREFIDLFTECVDTCEANLTV